MAGKCMVLSFFISNPLEAWITKLNIYSAVYLENIDIGLIYLIKHERIFH